MLLKKFTVRILEAGADIICTNTFGGTPLVLNEYDLGDKADEINTACGKISKRSCSGIFNFRVATFCSRCNGSNDKNAYR